MLKSLLDFLKQSFSASTNIDNMEDFVIDDEIDESEEDKPKQLIAPTIEGTIPLYEAMQAAFKF